MQVGRAVDWLTRTDCFPNHRLQFDCQSNQQIQFIHLNPRCARQAASGSCYVHDLALVLRKSRFVHPHHQQVASNHHFIYLHFESVLVERVPVDGSHKIEGFLFNFEFTRRPWLRGSG